MSLTDNVDGRTAWHRLAHATDDGGDTSFGIQATRKLIHIGSRCRDKQTTRRLWIVQRVEHARLQVLVSRHARAKEVLVAVGARGNNAQARHVEHLVKERYRSRRKLNLHTRALGHLARVPDQAKARDIGTAVKLESLGQTSQTWLRPRPAR